MAIGSAPEIGREFITGGEHRFDLYEWMNPDGTAGYIQRGYAKLCFIDNRPQNVYPTNGEYTLVTVERTEP